MNVQSKLSAGYQSNTTASMIRSIHNSAGGRPKSGSQNSGPRRSAGSGGDARDCCNIKKVQFDLSNDIAPNPRLIHQTQQNKGKGKRGTSRSKSGNTRPANQSSSSYFKPRTKKTGTGKGQASGAHARNTSTTILTQQSATNPNLVEDRPRQLPASPSAKATQKFFFKKQVQSIEQNATSVNGARRRNAPRQGSSTQVDTLSKQIVR